MDSAKHSVTDVERGAETDFGVTSRTDSTLLHEYIIFVQKEISGQRHAVCKILKARVAHGEKGPADS